ncbi:Bifunctional purine biosynthesis protein PurH [Morus notabilis]|uniref:Bifunctional purine biosynthesis protein PurH n=1 Tax=Morus notabilis TaxID=981085 RepID=W9S859_9ROSA|nr:Bifunctional purine biosynthesis protein PurH [Morus notabilis]
MALFSLQEIKRHGMEALDKLGIGPIDIVVVNLYNSESDIGVHPMIRAAVKAVMNQEKVLVVVNPEDYSSVLEFLRSNQDDHQFPSKLADKAKRYAIAYDSAHSAGVKILIRKLHVIMLIQFFVNHGKMSYNNYLDAEAAWNCVTGFEEPTCVIVKHTNPCGVASRDDILEAYRLGVRGDQ